MIKLLFISLLFLSSQLQAQWGHWEKLETDTLNPGERWGIEMATIGDKKAILFGGETDGSVKLSDTWLFDYPARQWTKVNCQSSPTPRKDFTLTQISEKQVLLFGGWSNIPFGRTGGIRNDFWAFDLDSMNWFKVFEDTSIVNLARYRHKTSIFNDSILIIFAGSDWQSRPTSDVWLYNYEKHVVVNRIMNSNPWIKNRGDHQMERITDNQIYVFGGHSESSKLDDNLIFDGELELKRMLDIVSNCEPTSAAQMKHIRDGFLLMFGGLPSNSVEMTWGDKTRIFDFNNRIWTELDLEEHPIGRLDYGMTLIDTNTVMIYGGLITGAKNLAHKTETWIFQLDSVPTSVENSNTEESIIIAPNPANDFIEINISPLERGSGGVSVFDVLGQIQSTSVNFVDTSAGGGHIRIDISNLSPGVYFVRVGNKVLKFIKI